MIPGITPLRGADNLTVATVLNVTANGTTTASVSFGNVTVPTTNSLIVVTCLGRASAARTINSISIGGTTATLHLASASSTAPTAIASRIVTTAGAQNVTAVFSSTTQNAVQAIGVWAMTPQSTAPTGTDNQAPTASTAISTTFPVTAGGAGVWACRNDTTNPNVYSGKDVIITQDSTLAVSRYTFAVEHFYATVSSYVQTVSNSTSASRTLIGGAWR